MAYGDLKVRNLIWNTGSGDNTVVLSTLATENYVTTNFAPKNAPTFTGTINGADLILSGNLTVNGTQTIINTQTLDVEDKQIEIGKVSSPSDITADQGGIVLKGATDKTFLWVNANVAWTSSENIKLPDNKKLLVGTGSDLQIFHTNGHSYISSDTGDLIIGGGNGASIKLQPEGGENGLTVTQNGAVELYYDGVKAFQTDANGIWVLGPEGGNAEVNLFADEADDNADKWRLQADTSGNLKVANYSTGSWVDGLTLDGSNNATFAADVTFTGANANVLWDTSADALKFSDSVKARFGTGNDLSIYHDGSNSYIDEGGTGHLYIRNGTDAAIICETNGSVELFHNNSGKLITTTTGVTVTGMVSDSKGDLRKIIQNTQGSAYTLVAADAGKHILASGNITIPNSVFAAGDGVVIVNNTSGDLTITSTITNLYLGSDGSTGNKKLASRCTCTVLFTSGTAGYISGGGLTAA